MHVEEEEEKENNNKGDAETEKEMLGKEGKERRRGKESNENQTRRWTMRWRNAENK